MYQVVATLAGLLPELCVRVYEDVEYRRQWDRGVVAAQTLAGQPADAALTMWWVTHWPWPLADRAYLYRRRVHTRPTPHGDAHIVLATALSDADEAALPKGVVPTRAGVVRVRAYDQTVVFMPPPLRTAAGTAGARDARAAGRPATRVFVRYYEDPGGSMPTAMVGTGVAASVPALARDFVHACRDYDAYVALRANGDSEGTAAEQLKQSLDEGLARAFAGF
jgi:hypothetical protein